MSNIIDFEENTPHMVRKNICLFCKYRCIGVIALHHNTEQGLQCPMCKKMTIAFEWNAPDPEPPPLRCIQCTVRDVYPLNVLFNYQIFPYGIFLYIPETAIFPAQEIMLSQEYNQFYHVVNVRKTVKLSDKICQILLVTLLTNAVYK